MGGKTRNIAIQLVSQQCFKTSCMFFVARFKITNVITEIAFSQIGWSNYAVQSVVVDVFSRLNFNGIFFFVPLKKLTCILSSVLRGIIKLPNFIPRRAGYESIYYGINNTRATWS